MLLDPAMSAASRRLERDVVVVAVRGCGAAAGCSAGSVSCGHRAAEVRVAVLAVLLDLDGVVGADDRLERLVELVDGR
jgi:hypothetical protein